MELRLAESAAGLESTLGCSVDKRKCLNEEYAENHCEHGHEHDCVGCRKAEDFLPCLLLGEEARSK